MLDLFSFPWIRSRSVAADIHNLMFFVAIGFPNSGEMMTVLNMSSTVNLESDPL